MKIRKYVPRHPVLTGEDIVLAAPWQRYLASLIDFFVVIGLFFIVINIIKMFGIDLNKVNIKGIEEVEVKAKGVSEMGIRCLKIGFASIPTVYFALVNYFTNGKTLGKWIMRIRVVSIYHHRISFWHCVERALGYVASTLEAGLGFLQIFWNPNRMCLHDRIAETIVVQDKRKK